MVVIELWCILPRGVSSMEAVAFQSQWVPGVTLYLQCWLSDGTGTTVEMEQATARFISQDHLNTFHTLANSMSIIQPLSHLMMPRCSRRSVLPAWVAVLQPHSSFKMFVTNRYTKTRWPRMPPKRRPAWRILETGMLTLRMNRSEGFPAEMSAGHSYAQTLIVVRLSSSRT